MWKAKSPYKLNGMVTKKTYASQTKAQDAVMKSKGKYKVWKPNNFDLDELESFGE